MDIAYEELEKVGLEEDKKKRELRILAIGTEEKFIEKKKVTLNKMFEDVGFMVSSKKSLTTTPWIFKVRKVDSWSKTIGSYIFDFIYANDRVHAEIYYHKCKSGNYYITGNWDLEGARAGWVGPLPIQEVYAESLEDRITETNSAIDTMLIDFKDVLTWLADSKTNLNETPVSNPVKAFNMTPNFYRRDTSELRSLSLKHGMTTGTAKHNYRFRFNQNRMTEFSGSLICFTKSIEMGERIEREVKRLSVEILGKPTRNDLRSVANELIYSWDREGGKLQISFSRQGVFLKFKKM